ncbi:hypothetical protein [Clostridium sp.]|uniref:hypothetical protein n=1 Tax=Clostridium sp. TaxID=1506 RepID=UPI0025C2CDAF|nr:hypothetical protein [Clostridium sp.]
MITEKILLENNLYPNSVKYYFGNINKAYELANVKPNHKQQERLSSSDIITRMNNIIPMFKKNNIPFTVKELKKHEFLFIF